MKSKILTVVLAVALAFGLWLYVINVVSPESEMTYYDIPVILQNEDILSERGMMIVSETPKVTLQLTGNRTDLNNLNEANINLIVNVATISTPGTHSLGFQESYPGNVDVATASKNPSRVTIKVENRIKKTVPVVIDYMGTTVPEDFIADTENAQLDYAYVDVVGPQSTVDQITQAVIQVSLEGKEETIVDQQVYTLCNAQGDPVDAALVTTNVENINVTVKIQRLKELEFTVVVVDGGGATEQTCTITIEPKKIRVTGSDQILEDLESIELGTINLGELPKDTTLTFPVILPEGVTNEAGVTEAQVKVNFPALKTRSFKVTSILPINVPEGLEVDMITQALTVKVRGPSGLVKNMNASDITVTVDFSGKQVGTETMKANVVIASAYSEVGVLENYTVSAALREPDPDATTAG